MRIIPYIDRLKNATTVFGTRIDRAYSIESERDLSGTPSAFVYCIEDSAIRNELLGGDVSQELVERFIVRIAARHVDIINGIEPVEDARDEIFSALVGWRIDNQHDPVEFVTGKVVEVTPDIVWWNDIFETKSSLRG